MSGSASNADRVVSLKAVADQPAKEKKQRQRRKIDLSAIKGPAFIRACDVLEISGFSDDTLYRWIKIGRFPAPIIEEKNRGGKLAAGEKTTLRLWDLAEVMAWRAAQFKKRDERNSGQQAAQQVEASA